MNSLSIKYTSSLSKSLLIISFCISFAGSVLSQKTTKIRLVQSESMQYDKSLGENVKRVIGNVIFEHDSTYLLCDSAYLNDKTNSLDAYGNVRIKVSDTLNIYSDFLNYKGNEKVAYLNKNVRLVDDNAILTTDNLVYDRKTKIAHYFDGGRIIDTENDLTSKIGYYYTNSKEFFFKDSVVLINPKYTVTSDTLMYNTTTEVSYFLGPSYITSNENIIYCENGWYNTLTDISRFSINAYLQKKEQKIQGDSLFYDRNLGIGKATNNVTLIDTVQNIIVTGNNSFYDEKKLFTYMTDSATAILIDNSDSLFLHSDTLKLIFNDEQEAEILFAYYKTKFYKSDLQGKCDSLVYNIVDSTITLFNKPVIWTEENQLLADTIILITNDNSIEKMHMMNSSLIISKDDTNSFNQVKGKKMTSFFRDNELFKIVVEGNSETIYYVREEDKTLIGINQARSSEMLIFLENKEFKTITYLDRPDATLYPEEEIPEQERKLRGFIWLEEIRPGNKYDIYKRDLLPDDQEEMK
jgi:lipopolysaccharide export system protein LptA